MIILRLTRKLLGRVGRPTAVAAPSTTVLGDWFAQLVFVGHQRYVLLVSEHSRLPVIMPGRDLKNLARNFPGALAEVLQALFGIVLPLGTDVGARSPGNHPTVRTRSLGARQPSLTRASDRVRRSVVVRPDDGTARSYARNKASST